MKTTIYCTTNEKGTNTFYLNTDRGQYFLFRQDYRRGVNDYYKNGVTLEQATCFAKSHKDNALMRTMQKLPMYIKYVEKEFEISILNQTVKKNRGYARIRVA